MQRIDLWVDDVGVVSIDPGALQDSLLIEGQLGSGEINIARGSIQDDVYNDKYPATMEFIDNYITPTVCDHYHQLVGVEHDHRKLRITAEYKHSRENEGIFTHQHPVSTFTAVYYLVANPGHMYLIDPRGSACRDYPLWMGKKLFGQLEYVPQLHELVIVPSYIEHFVPAAPGHYRMALVVDYKFIE